MSYRTIILLFKEKNCYGNPKSCRIQLLSSTDCSLRDLLLFRFWSNRNKQSEDLFVTFTDYCTSMDYP